MKSNGAKIVVGIVVGWFVLASIGAATSYETVGRTALALSRSNSSTTGQITHLAAHYAVQYAFEVSGRSYEGISQLENSQDVAFKKIGEPISVYYVPADPTISSLLRPQVAKKRATSDLIWACVFFPLLSTPVLAFAVYRFISR